MMNDDDDDDDFDINSINYLSSSSFLAIKLLPIEKIQIQQEKQQIEKKKC
jgi:hypothetical protein